MADGSQNIVEKAQSRYIETQKKTAERNKATAEYLTEAKQRAAKTAKLRALRLAKEEADRAAEALNPPVVKKKRPSRAAAKTKVADANTDTLIKRADSA